LKHALIDSVRRLKAKPGLSDQQVKDDLNITNEDPSHTTFTVLRAVEAICRLADRLKRE